MQKKILLVDDDLKLLDVLEPFLRNEGFATMRAQDGLEALTLLMKQPDLIVLDIMMPHLDGKEVCRRIRQISQVPIIMLTALDEEADKLESLDLGADDYIAKPFSMRELAARIRAVLRRASGPLADTPPQTQKLAAGGLVLDSLRHTVQLDGKMLELTPIEFTLLEVLMRHPGQVLNRLQLMEQSHGFAFDGYERTIDAHIRNLRRKIEQDTRKPTYILTVYGVGYRFGGDADE
ncbi:putative OmpR family two-component system response regulator [Selenomonas ruminantium subsp. lactilytica TAM6421]|uniref:Putative OmpR family two-component system response regulator n=1 Tax=Selenomonas ruminantium subsp. lactilytica (strain NBRC 103574 / TAM6421) TaxID=927704 RepID=I0GUM6_SELRL|nr:response regulator transcription factor [Selenomonas ruminantium]BAL84463.1 putative OmpR family two-component system response regulator [Selenomonas ruminantium subsp. lactilytica TAM6421]